MLTTVFAAVSIKRFINDVGDYVGFASIVAVALLILLYFSHARETATLRERLDEAQARIAGLEARIAQLLHAQASAQRGRPAAPVQPAPVPSPVRPMGSAIASVRRVPAAATAAAGAGAAAAGAAATLAPPPPPAVASPAAANGLPPAAPVGMAAPALASATKLIPDPPRPVRPPNRPDDTIFVPAAAAATAAAANGQAEPATRALPAVAAASAANPSITARPRTGAAGPPRVQIGADAEPASRPRRTIPRSRAIPGGGMLLPPEDESGGLAGRLLPLVIGGVAVIVIIVGLILITTSGGGSTSANVPHGNSAGSTGTTGQSLSQHHSKAPIFKPASVRVSVLNGTAVANLAADVGNKLASAGYKQGNITNAASQTEPTTIVFYLPGASAKANKTAAQHVATQLKLPASSVRPATQSAIQSCSTSVTGTVGTSCDADVIVSVGTDRADLASGNGG